MTGLVLAIETSCDETAAASVMPSRPARWRLRRGAGLMRQYLPEGRWQWRLHPRNGATVWRG